ncbi:hypothetical protein QVD17_24399 [Tagetes erecta]|uniref:Retrotransposon gag domain-containing protein n=1 Tax=Tagetes erecta TaxID=13708 RepID=A0AAD8KF23_TARER|nr:hypothetical protein QVD17_24399 [Tagetes erecta]
MMSRRPRNSNRKIASIVAREVAAVIPTLLTHLNSGSNGGGSNPPASECSFKKFSSCNPTKFSGSEGATGLLQWFESMENTFLNCDCPDNLKVRHATSVFQKRALTWWNGEKRTRGVVAAMALKWEEVKDLMTKEFCPRNEIKKLETEFWDLVQVGGENSAYTNRFHELSLLVPHLVTPLSRGIEKYICGLPMVIQDTVWGRNPTTLEDTIRLAAQLTDNHVKDGSLTRKGDKKNSEKSSFKPSKHDKTESSSRNNKRKAKNYVEVSNVVPTTQCTNCGRFGHTFNICRSPTRVPVNAAMVQPTPAINQARACHQFGDPNHLRNACPQLIKPVPVARGRAFNINALQAQTNNDVVNGMFLINNIYASVLFDFGADKSFVSLEFEPLLANAQTKLDEPYTVEVADGKVIKINSIISNCTLNLNEHNFSIDLTPMELGSFDVIIGMDWLSKNRAEIVCCDKYIRIPLSSGDVLNIYGESPSNGLKLMSCTKAQKYLSKNYVAFLAHVVKEDDKSKKVEDIPVIRDFPEVFPEDLTGFPPIRQVEFRIDLVPGATPVAKSPYRLAPSEMQELASQLQELSDKGFIRPSSSPW